MSSLFHSLGRTASAGIAAAALFASGAHAAEDLPTLFTNVNVFDGVNETMIENANVVVTGNLISAIDRAAGRRGRHRDRWWRAHDDTRSDRCTLACLVLLHRPKHRGDG